MSNSPDGEKFIELEGFGKNETGDWVGKCYFCGKPVRGNRATWIQLTRQDASTSVPTHRGCLSQTKDTVKVRSEGLPIEGRSWRK